jgi:hypothetical protein
VNLFVELADNSDDVPQLKGKEYADFQLDRKDWERMKQMKDVLHVRRFKHPLLVH